jgi:hypothetical protein
MRVLLALGAAAGIATAGIALTAATNAQKSATKLSYYMECFPLKSVGNDINAQASQGWTVTAIVDHASSTGQQCLLVLFQRETP